MSAEIEARLCKLDQDGCPLHGFPAHDILARADCEECILLGFYRELRAKMVGNWPSPVPQSFVNSLGTLKVTV